MVALAQVHKSASMRNQIDYVSRGRLESEQLAHGLEVMGVEGGKISGLMDALQRGAEGFQWTGAAAAAAGLVGTVDTEQAVSVFENCTLPDGRKIAQTGNGGTGAFGVVRSESKTVSLLLAHPDPAVRQAVLDAHEAANATFVREIERLTRSRMGKAGVTSVPVKGLLAASISHYSSSAGDPTLHRHFEFSRRALCEDGQWRAIDGNAFFAARGPAEAAAQAELARQLKIRLGLDVKMRQTGDFGHVAEIPALTKQAEKLSQAGQDVDRVLSEMSGAFGETWAQRQDAWRNYRVNDVGALAEEIENGIDAALMTPEGHEAMRDIWERRAPGLQADLAKVKALANDPGQAPTIQPSAERVEAVKKAALAWAERQDSPLQWHKLTAQMTASLGQHAAAVAALDLIEAHAVRTPDLEAMARAVRASLAHENCETADLKHLYGTGGRFTTQPAVKRAVEIVNTAKDLASQTAVRLAIEVPDGASQEQAAAIQKMAEGRRLTVISGAAGAGKTFALSPAADAARAAAEHSGLAVYSIARNAARGLETGEGVKADSASSIALFLQKEPETLGGLLIIDEGGVIDRAEYKQLLNFLERRPDFQAVIMGDKRQAQSIDRLDTWSLVEEGAKQSGAFVELKASRRCKNWLQEHDVLRARSAPAAMLKHIEAEGRLQPVTFNNYARKAAAILTADPNSTAIVATNDEAASISHHVQTNRGITPQLRCLHGNGIGVGDVVRTRKNLFKKSVHNGDVWTVSEIHPDRGAILKNEAGKFVAVGLDYVRDYLELGYASTLDSAQGITVNRAVVVVSEGMGNTGLYSATTRGRAAPIYLTIVDSGLDDPKAAARDRLTACIEKEDAAENVLNFVHEQQAVPELVWMAEGAAPIADTPPAAAPPAPAPEPTPAPQPRSPRHDAVLAMRRARAQAALEIRLQQQPQPEPKPEPVLLNEPPEPPTWEPPAP